MKFIFLLNSFSLREDCERIANEVDNLAKELNLDYEIRINSKDLSTEEILEDYRDGENVIVSLGGDGTLNRILNSIYGTRNMLSILPLGTGNDYVRSVRNQLEQGINSVDVVRINDSYFINLVCFGIDADIGNDETFVNSKIVPRSQRYNATIVTNFLNYHGRHMKIMADNLTYEGDYTTVAVCNGTYYGRGFTMAPHARIDDGLLDVYLIDNTNKIAMIKIILGVKKGKHEKSSKTHSFQTNKLTIEGDKPITCNYDGEKMTSKKYDIELIPKGIKLYYNEELEKEFVKIKTKK